MAGSFPNRAVPTVIGALLLQFFIPRLGFQNITVSKCNIGVHILNFIENSVLDSEMCKYRFALDTVVCGLNKSLRVYDSLIKLRSGVFW